ncbi:sirohydrochlorin chelatase [Streptomyces sp. NPDC052040]|uniref:sirohydrochlorin chelatase n=1 Tax=Streptomyces sp. NPDC052040 TaxID=3365682 RepID=UPI0037D0F5F9
MTASTPSHDESCPGPGDRSLHGVGLDSTAQLMGRIASRLGSRLGLVALDGTRRPDPPALVLVARGGRDPRAFATARALAERVRELRPRLPVHLCRLGPTAPPEPPGTGPAVLVPLLLGRGHHTGRVLPDRVAASLPGTLVAAPLGPHPLLVEALYARLVEAGWPTAMSDARRRASAVVLAAAGSRDPDAAADTRRTALLLAERLGVPVVPAHARRAAPTVAAAVRSLGARGHHRIAVAPYLMAPGRLATECAAAAPWITAAPLGAHAAVARLVLHRYDEALATPGPPATHALATA